MDTGIFLCGAAESGKTTTLKMVANKLVNEENWNVEEITLQESGWEEDKDSKGEYNRKSFEGTVEETVKDTVKNHDYIYILEKDGKKILIYTCGDMPKAHIDAFNIAEEKKVDILIHAIRDKTSSLKYIKNEDFKKKIVIVIYRKKECLDAENKNLANEIVEDVKKIIKIINEKNDETQN